MSEKSRPMTRYQAERAALAARQATKRSEMRSELEQSPDFEQKMQAIQDKYGISREEAHRKVEGFTSDMRFAGFGLVLFGLGILFVLIALLG